MSSFCFTIKVDRPPTIIPPQPHYPPNQPHKPIELKDAILQSRNRKNLSQSQLAKLIKGKSQIIQDFESGKAIPSQETISKLEKALGVNFQDIYKAKLKEVMVKARTNKFVTQAQLAQKMKVKINIIQDYENGKVIPNKKMMSQLEKALGVKLQ